MMFFSRLVNSNKSKTLQVDWLQKRANRIRGSVTDLQRSLQTTSKFDKGIATLP